jgi:signal transduction histidine kinase
MNEIGLAAAISEWLEEQIAKRYDLEIEFIENIGDDHRNTLDENVRALLFRNVQELLANVVKHARANKLLVYITEDNARVKIVVEDDGVGFDPDTRATKNKQDDCFGLFSIRERMTDLGGSFDIQSEPGKGCRVVLTMPVEEGKD